MFLILRVFSLIGIYLNSSFIQIIFSLPNYMKSNTFFFNPIIDVTPVIPMLFFLLTFVWQAAASFFYVNV